MKYKIILSLLLILFLSGCTDNICKFLNDDESVWEKGWNEGGCRKKEETNKTVFSELLLENKNLATLRFGLNDINKILMEKRSEENYIRIYCDDILDSPEQIKLSEINSIVMNGIEICKYFDI